MPRVSVLMAAFNGEAYLGTAIDSILRQTFEDFELIVVDDGSTDRSAGILEAHAQREPRLRPMLRPHRGLVPSLNEGLQAARAPYLARMDADDVAHPERLARQVRYLDEHPECVALGSRVLFIDPDGLPVCPSGEALSHEEIDAAHMRGDGGAIVHPAAMLRTDAVRAIGGYDADRRHAEDHDLFLRLAELGRLANLSDILLEYRLHTGSVCHRYRAEQLRSSAAAVRDACRRRHLPLPPLPAPDVQPATQEEPAARRWGWWALAAGNLRTARKHAALALRSDPFALASWRLLACALRGY